MSSQVLWAPGTRGTAEQLNAGDVWKFESIADLKAEDTSGYGLYANDRDILANVKEFGIYRFELDSTLIADDELVIKPTTGPGRWILEEMAAPMLSALYG